VGRTDVFVIDSHNMNTSKELAVSTQGLHITFFWLLHLTFYAVSNLVQAVQIAGGQAQVYLGDGPGGWTPTEPWRRLRIQTCGAYLPTVFNALLQMTEVWTEVDVYADFKFSMVLAAMVVDVGGCADFDTAVGPQGVFNRRDYFSRALGLPRRELRYSIGNQGVHLHIVSPGQFQPRRNLDVLLEV
jgi:hypothetical protein